MVGSWVLGSSCSRWVCRRGSGLVLLPAAVVGDLKKVSTRDPTQKGSRSGVSPCTGRRQLVRDEVTRGQGAGRALLDELLSRPRDAGYRTMYVETSARQTEAIALCRELGFEEVAPYYDVPDEMRERLLFFRLEL